MSNEVFISKEVVQSIAGGKHDSTLWRWERLGIFPKREQIGPNTTVYRKSLIDEWAEDPQGWAKKHRESQAA